MSDLEIMAKRQNILDAALLGFITQEDADMRMKRLYLATVKRPSYGLNEFLFRWNSPLSGTA